MLFSFQNTRYVLYRINSKYDAIFDANVFFVKNGRGKGWKLTVFNILAYHLFIQLS